MRDLGVVTALGNRDGTYAYIELARAGEVNDSYDQPVTAA